MENSEHSTQPPVQEIDRIFNTFAELAGIFQDNLKEKEYKGQSVSQEDINSLEVLIALTSRIYIQGRHPLQPDTADTR